MMFLCVEDSVENFALVANGTVDWHGGIDFTDSNRVTLQMARGTPKLQGVSLPTPGSKCCKTRRNSLSQEPGSRDTIKTWKSISVRVRKSYGASANNGSVAPSASQPSMPQWFALFNG